MDKRGQSFVSAVLTLFTVVALTCSALASGVLPSDGGGYFGTDYDFGGQTVTIGHWAKETPLARFSEGGLAEGRLEEAEELFNCRIQFDGVGYADLGEWYLARLMSGDSKNDIWFIQNCIAYWPLASMDAFCPIEEVVGDDYWERLHPYSLRISDILVYGGRRYVFANTIDMPKDAVWVDTGLYLVFYNKTMLENAGVEDPYDLYKAGEWTWDRYEEIAKKLTIDTNADGHIDVWGSGLISDQFAAAFIQASGIDFTSTDEEGRVVYSFGGEKAETALNRLAKWNMVDRVFNADGAAAPAWTAGKAAMLVHAMWHYPTFAGTVDFEFGIVPLPKSPFTDRHIAPAHGIGGVVLPQNAQDPEALMALHEFLFRDPEEIFLEGIENTQNMFVSREDLDVALTLSEEWQGETVLLRCGEFTQPALRTQAVRVMHDVIWGSATLSESLGSRRPVIQGLLDTLFKQ